MSGIPWPGMKEVTEWAVRIEGNERPLGFGTGKEARAKAERFITDNPGKELQLVFQQVILTGWQVSV